MSSDNVRKSFPYLRKGDGLQRYSTLKYPRCQQRKTNFNLMNDDEKRGDEIAKSPALVDSGNGSSANNDELISNNDHQIRGIDNRNNVSSTPKEADASILEPSLIDRRTAWEAKEQRDNLEAHHFEALERFLAAMNSTLKSDSSALFKLGSSATQTPLKIQAEDNADGAHASSEERNNFREQADEKTPTDSNKFSPRSVPPQLANMLPQRPQQPASFSNLNQNRWRYPQPDQLFPPSILPNHMMQAPFSFPDNVAVGGRFNPPANNPAMGDIEKELRNLMTNLERDADELQRRRVLLDEHIETTKKQLCAEWQSVEHEKEILKVQRMKIEQDKNDLLTHRMRMEEETRAKSEKSDKAQEELKMLQSECQLLKKKLMEQKKQSSEEVSSVQQQVIDLQRQAVETDSRASSHRTQITKLKDECRQSKEEADSARARMKLLESSNERLRAENAQLRINFIEQRDKSASNGSAIKCLKTSTSCGGGVGDDQNKFGQSQTAKCVRFADEPTTFRRTKDSCVQAAGPSDMATQTSFLESSPSLDKNWPIENNAILQRTIGGGKKEVIYPNNTVQIRDHDGADTFNYASGDVLRCLPDGTKIYHSAADGRTEIRNADGTLMVKNADGSSEKYTFMPDGTEIVTYSNGTVVEKRAYGVEVAYLYDKSKETRCSHYTLREFPSGDMKKLFSDGSTETRLACGRVRIKDAEGNVIKDVDEYPMRPPS